MEEIIKAWIPAYAGMTKREAGMTKKEAGMTKKEAGMTKREAAITTGQKVDSFVVHNVEDRVR